MKSIILLFSLIFCSFFINSTVKKLPDGKYFVELDQKYIDSGWKNFEIVIENDICTLEIAKKLEKLEVKWIDENSFIVRGYTEPINPNNVEEEIMKKNIISFNITREEENVFYFTLGNQLNSDIVYSGKFIRTEK